VKMSWGEKTNKQPKSGSHTQITCMTNLGRIFMVMSS